MPGKPTSMREGERDLLSRFGCGDEPRRSGEPELNDDSDNSQPKEIFIGQAATSSKFSSTLRTPDGSESASILDLGGRGLRTHTPKRSAAQGNSGCQHHMHCRAVMQC
jgi:hypothetical protein